MSAQMSNRGFMLEFLTYMTENSGLEYELKKTAFVGQSPDAFDDSPTILESKRQQLTVFEESGQVERTMRRSWALRQVRFVLRGKHPNDAIERAWDVLDWLEELAQRQIELTSFIVWNMRSVSAPSATQRRADGTSLADFVQEFSVQKKVT